MITWISKDNNIHIQITNLLQNTEILLCSQKNRTLVDLICTTIVDSINTYKESIKLVPHRSTKDEGYLEFSCRKINQSHHCWKLTLVFSNINHLNQRDKVSTLITHEQLNEFNKTAPTSDNFIKTFEK